MVIPQRVRRQLGITPKTTLAVYVRKDKFVVAKVDIPPVGEGLRHLFEEIDRQRKTEKRRLPSEKEVLEEIMLYRQEKRKS